MDPERIAALNPLLKRLIDLSASWTLLVGILIKGIPASRNILKAIAFSLAGKPKIEVKYNFGSFVNTFLAW